MKPLKPYSYLHMSLLAWLAENPEERILTQGSGVRGQPMDFRFRYRKLLKDRDEWFYSHLDTPTYPTMTDKVAPSVEEFLNTRHLKFSVVALQNDGMLDLLTGFDLHDKTKESRLKALVAPNSRKYALSDKFYGITEKAVTWWNESGHALYRELLTTRFTQEASDERTILIGKERSISAKLTAQQSALFPGGFPNPLPSRKIVRPYATAVVVKEIENGFYIRDVRLLSHRMRDGGGDFIQIPIEERRPHAFVSREAVLADYVNDHGVNIVLTADNEIYQDIAETQARALDELIPFLTRYRDLQRQQASQQEDQLREALDKANNSALTSEDPKPKL